MDITFKDSLTGWFCAATTPDHVTGGTIYKTTDGGVSWISGFSNQFLELAAIYYSPASRRVFASLWNNGQGLIYSTDDGTDWEYANHDYSNIGFASIDSVILVTAIGRQARTTDAGLNWTESYPLPNYPNVVECWQPYADTARRLFFEENDADDIGLDASGFYCSTDEGLTWQANYYFPFYYYVDGSYYDETGGPNGCIAGDSSGNLYIQKIGDGEGVYCSSDSGRSWLSICGPSNKLDTRFCVFNNMLFAGGYIGDSEGIWELPLANPNRILLDSATTLVGTRCQEVSKSIHFASTFPCPSIVSLDSVSLQGNARLTIDSDTPTFDLTQGSYLVNVHYESLDSLDTAYLIFHYTENGILHDTSVTIYGMSMPDASHSFISIEELGDTTINPGDSVGITFVPGAGTLAATDSVRLVLRYDPNAVSLSSLTVPTGWWVSDSSRVDTVS